VYSRLWEGVWKVVLKSWACGHRLLRHDMHWLIWCGVIDGKCFCNMKRAGVCAANQMLLETAADRSESCSFEWCLGCRPTFLMNTSVPSQRARNCNQLYKKHTLHVARTHTCNRKPSLLHGIIVQSMACSITTSPCCRQHRYTCHRNHVNHQIMGLTPASWLPVSMSKHSQT
jgi:hypothetical protein